MILHKVSAQPTLFPSITRRDGAGRAATRAAAPFAFRVVEIDLASACTRPAHVPSPLPDSAGTAQSRRTQVASSGQSLRSGTLPRIGELRTIAQYRAERPGAPAAAAERRAAFYNAEVPVHRGGGLRLMALCGHCGSGLLASSSAWALGPDGPSVGTGRF